MNFLPQKYLQLNIYLGKKITANDKQRISKIILVLSYARIWHH